MSCTPEAELESNAASIAKPEQWAELSRALDLAREYLRNTQNPVYSAPAMLTLRVAVAAVQPTYELDSLESTYQ